MYSVYRDYTFTVGDYRFGLMDANHDFQGDVTLLHAGPLGEYYRVPVSATVGWAITLLFAASMLAAALWLAIGRRPRRLERPSTLAAD